MPTVISRRRDSEDQAASLLDARLVVPPSAVVPALLADGNGRVGRILIAWILWRRLALVTQPPVSTCIAADVGGYGSGLVLFRLGDHNAWVRWFADAVSGAGRAQRELVASVDHLRLEWKQRLAEPRSGARRLRSDAAVWRVLDLLPRHLVLRGPAVAAALSIPLKSANAALRQLVDVGVLVDGGTSRRRDRVGRAGSTQVPNCSVSSVRTRAQLDGRRGRIAGRTPEGAVLGARPECLAAVFEFVSAKVFDALSSGHVDDAKSGQRVGPPPAEGSVEGEADQEDA